MIMKLLGLALIVGGLYWAYGHVAIDDMAICVDAEKEVLPITCEDQTDCVNYLTSAYTVGYPRTDLFTSILAETTECGQGHCLLKSFDFEKNLPSKQCGANQTMLSYKVTAKDIIAIKGGQK